ncbi:MAG: rod shape-determining protein [Candidatus Competibacterales bacterium]
MANTYHVGIDLGTSRTCIVTSTGQRKSTRTCVGYPKDVISRKRIGKDYLLGDDALDNQLSLNVVWPLADGVVREDERSIQATGLILRHIINVALPQLQADDKVNAAIGVPAQASINNKKLILGITQEFLDKVLIVSEALNVAYALDRFDECLIVDIGAGTTDLCRMHGSMPEADDQITLNIAGNYLDAEIKRALLAKYPEVQLSSRIIRRIKEKYGYVSETSDPVVVNLTERGIPKQYDITQIMRESCLKLTQPISEAIQTLVGTFDPDFQAKLRNNIIIAGGGSRLKGIDLAIERSLQPYGGGDAQCVEDVEYCGSIGALKMCLDMPDDYWEQL